MYKNIYIYGNNLIQKQLIDILICLYISSSKLYFFLIQNILFKLLKVYLIKYTKLKNHNNLKSDDYTNE